MWLFVALLIALAVLYSVRGAQAWRGRGGGGNPSWFVGRRYPWFEPPTSSVSDFEQGPSDAALRHIKEVNERQAAEDRAAVHEQALAAGSDLDVEALLQAERPVAAGQLVRERLLSAFSAGDAHKTEVYRHYLAQLGLDERAAYDSDEQPS